MNYDSDTVETLRRKARHGGGEFFNDAADELSTVRNDLVHLLAWINFKYGIDELNDATSHIIKMRSQQGSETK